IWQTVWLEEVPPQSVAALRVEARLDRRVEIEIETHSDAPTPEVARVEASLDGAVVARAEGPPGKLVLDIPDPRPWSPDSPTLYDLEVTLGDDRVTSYVGLREVSRRRDADGHWRL